MTALHTPNVLSKLRRSKLVASNDEENASTRREVFTGPVGRPRSNTADVTLTPKLDPERRFTPQAETEK